MPSPLAHVGLALCLGAALARGPLPVGRALVVRAGWLALAAVAADLDILVDLAVPGAHAHHGPTHSLLGALALGLLVARAARGRSPDGPALVGAALLHVPLDWSTGDPGADAARYGVMALWPLSAERFIDPSPWFLPYYIDREGGLLNMVTPAAIGPYLREAGTVGAGALVVALGRRYRTTSS